MPRSITQRDIILQYYTEHPDRDISHPEVVDWATKEYTVKTGRVFRDPDRQIRQLHQQGYLIKVKKGGLCPTNIYHLKIIKYIDQMIIVIPNDKGKT